LRKVLIATCTLLACLGIHESGHVIAAYLSGGAIGDFVLFSLRPHVRILGQATPAQEAFRAVAGSVASLLACFAMVLVIRSRTAAWQLAKDTATAFACVELIGWSLSSIMHTRSVSPDDAERFLAASGASAYLVVAVCALIGYLGVLVFRLDERRSLSYILRGRTHEFTGDTTQETTPTAKAAAAGRMAVY
jgi:hypothetical protein